jgi:hypothetical protein
MLARRLRIMASTASMDGLSDWRLHSTEDEIHSAPKLSILSCNIAANLALSPHSSAANRYVVNLAS